MILLLDHIRSVILSTQNLGFSYGAVEFCPKFSCLCLPSYKIKPRRFSSSRHILNLNNYFLCFVGPTLTFSTTVVLGCFCAYSIDTNLPVSALLPFSTVFAISRILKLILCGDLPIPLRYTQVLYTIVRLSSFTLYVPQDSKRNIRQQCCSVSLPLLKPPYHLRNIPKGFDFLLTASTCNLMHELHVHPSVGQFCLHSKNHS